MGRQSLKIDRSSVNSANHLRLYMEDKPAASETIAVPEETKAPVESEPEPEPEPVSVDPVTEFRKGRAKREAKRKEVKVITEYVPPEDPQPAPAPVNVPSAESIADRVVEILSAKRQAEEEKPKPVRKAPKKKEPTPPPSPPPTKYFGWC